MADAVRLWPLTNDARRAVLRQAEAVGVAGDDYRRLQHATWAMLGLAGDRRRAATALQRARSPLTRRRWLVELAAVDGQGRDLAALVDALLHCPGRDWRSS